MTGGLINIISYGADDLFLTGAPEITFFKIVYRRYTNFSKESILVSLGDIDFGKTVEIEIPKIGDLMSTTYLQIVIPEINIKRTDTATDLTSAELTILDTPYTITSPSYIDSSGNVVTINYVADYNLIKNYMSVNMVGYRKALKDVNIKNQTVNQYINSIINVIQAAASVATTQEIFQKYQTTVTNSYNYEVSVMNYVQASFLNYSFSDITYILTQVLNMINGSGLIVYGFVDPNLITVNNILTLVENAVKNCQSIYDYYYNSVKELQVVQTDVNSQYAKFAWVENLGHAIIDYIDVRIGGDTVDKHYGDWINIWYELTGSGDQQKLYKKMIGNTKEMITFDRNAKPQYNLYIPMTFWFSKFNGLAFPLIALQFNKIYVTVKLKSLEDCAYIEKLPVVDQLGNSIDLSPNALILTDIWNNLNLQLSGNLLIDYVFLESSERKRFAQSSHEYLIETVEVTSFDGLVDNRQNIELSFTGPSKEIFMVCQKNAYISNNMHSDSIDNIDNKSNYKSLWFNYTTLANRDEGMNPFSNITLEFNGYERFAAKENAILNYLMPWSHHTCTPSNGVNIFPFSLLPEEHQPTGSCNFTRITYPKLHFSIDNSMFVFNLSDIDPSIVPFSEDDKVLNTTVNVKIYSLRYNILRVMHGFSSKAYH